MLRQLDRSQFRAREKHYSPVWHIENIRHWSFTNFDMLFSFLEITFWLEFLILGMSISRFELFSLLFSLRWYNFPPLSHRVKHSDLTVAAIPSVKHSDFSSRRLRYVLCDTWFGSTSTTYRSNVNRTGHSQWSCVYHELLTITDLNARKWRWAKLWEAKINGNGASVSR